jgi:hypothetical protein
MICNRGKHPSYLVIAAFGEANDCRPFGNYLEQRRGAWLCLALQVQCSTREDFPFVTSERPRERNLVGFINRFFWRDDTMKETAIVGHDDES